MASSKQVKTILSQGRKIVTSTSSKQARATCETDVKLQDNDDSEEESSQQTNACHSG
jgi:hypothetical protein